MLLDRFINFFTSLKLGVVCLVLAMALVFFGTLAQVELGLYKAQNEFFRSFLVYWGPKGADWKVPVFPGGYLVGGVLLINLIATQWRRRQRASRWVGFSIAALGLLSVALGHFWLHSLALAVSGCFLVVFGLLRLDPVHGGIVLLLVGQLLTDLLAVESTLHLREGEVKNYSEMDRRVELAVVDVSDPDTDKVVAVPQPILAEQGEVAHPELPFTIRVKRFMPHSAVANRPANAPDPPTATQGLGLQLTVKELPRVTEMNKRDVPSAIVEIATPQGALGTWLVSEFIGQPQSFTLGGRTYELTLRPKRAYTAYSLKLLEFRHDKYPGTDIPKNFSSRVRLDDPKTGEQREVLIYMNNPLRHGGATYYQASYDTDNKGSILQVVRNPSWLTPYLACLLVSLGLVVQFLKHLLQFLGQRRTA